MVLVGVLLILLQLSLAAGAALVVGKGQFRKAAALTLVAASTIVPWLAPPHEPLLRVTLAIAALVAFMKVTQLASSATGTMQATRRLRHLFFLVPMRPRDGRRRPTTPTSRLWLDAAVHSALLAAAWILVSNLGVFGEPAHTVIRLTLGVVLLYTGMSILSDLTQLVDRRLGNPDTANQDSPILARTAGDFWGNRWNRCVSEWLNQFVFAPLARRRCPLVSVLAAFAVSAVMHSWVAGAALRDGRAALTMGSYFLLQGIIVLAETRLNLRKWPSAAARAWTIVVIAAPSPLGIDPFLRVFGF